MRGRVQPAAYGGRGGHRPSPLRGFAGYAFVLLATLFLAQVFLQRFGLATFTAALVGVLAASVLAFLSFRNLMVPFILLLLSIGGFRFLVTIKAPILPDLMLDRIALFWSLGVFMVKCLAERRSLRGPYLLDLFLFANLVYVLLSIYFFTDLSPFNLWTKSYFTAYATYYLAKNIITTRRRVRVFLTVLLILESYYAVTSIAEKYNINWLIWPKYIISDELWAGRSGGPFKHAPHFGTVIGMMMPVFLYFIATSRRMLVKLLLYAGLIASIGGLYFTYTRGSWLAGIGALLTAALLGRRHYLRVLVPALALVPILAIAVVGVKQDRFAKQRFENQDTLGSRIGTMVTAVRVWRAHPLFGVGFYQYRFIQKDYVRPVEAPILGTIRAAQFRHNPPHDIYFAQVAEMGLVNLILQGGIYLLILRAFLRRYRRRGDDDDDFANLVLPVFGGLFVGYLIGGLAIDYKFFSTVGTLFYSCAGILYGYRAEDYEGRGEAAVRRLPGGAAPQPVE